MNEHFEQAQKQSAQIHMFEKLTQMLRDQGHPACFCATYDGPAIFIPGLCHEGGLYTARIQCLFGNWDLVYMQDTPELLLDGSVNPETIKMEPLVDKVCSELKKFEAPDEPYTDENEPPC